VKKAGKENISRISLWPESRREKELSDLINQASSEDWFKREENSEY